MSDKSAGDGDTWNEAGESDGTLDSGSGGGSVDQPAWWRLDATLVVVDGKLDADVSTLDVDVIDEIGASLCRESVSISSVTRSSSLPDPAVLVWWQIDRGEFSGDCVDVAQPLPASVYVGVGAVHPEIEAVMGVVEEAAGVEDRLNGAYASLDTGVTTYVYGLAGTEAAWAGTGDALDSAQLSDETWLVRAIYPFRVE